MSLEFLVLDLDNTLYSPGSGVMEEIGRRIQVWICQELGMSWQEAADLRAHYLHRYGTSMGGLVAEHGIDARNYLDFVHQISIGDHLERSPILADMLRRIPLRKVIYTNATSEHALRVLDALGILEQFERIIGIEEVGFRNKSSKVAYRRMLRLLDASGKACVMVEDSPRNLPPAKAVGMTTVLIGIDDTSKHVDVNWDVIDYVVKSVLDVEQVVYSLLTEPTSVGAADGRSNG